MSNENPSNATDGLTANSNSVVQALLTDFYQITMAYAFWKDGKHESFTVYDLFFRKNPFKGEFTIFAGLHECLLFLNNFKFSKKDIDYIRTLMPPSTEEEFYQYLGTMSAKNLKLFAIPEGSVVFPKVPLIRVEGPLAIAQLVETTLLTLVNYASLVATNAARYRLAAGPNAKLLEMGLRRAQGPDGGLSASKYAFVGGFDATSNVLAAQRFGIPAKGTHAHAFIMSYDSVKSLQNRHLQHKDTGKLVDFVEVCQKSRAKLTKLLQISESQCHDGEWAAFISYALSFPDGFFALIDTYDTLKSGIVNFAAVAIALNELGYRAVGIRLDSGDLAYLSKQIYAIFVCIGDHFKLSWFKDIDILASNDINEETLISLNEQGHRITAFGIGTQLVTCQGQPALGCVYKLVEINQAPCIKLSQDLEKMTIPCRKKVFRLYSIDKNAKNKIGYALVDLIQKYDQTPVNEIKNEHILCIHPFLAAKRARVEPNSVCFSELLLEYFSNGQIQREIPTLEATRAFCKESLATIRPDHKRHLNPTPYKVSVTQELYDFIQKLWIENAPIGELK